MAASVTETAAFKANPSYEGLDYHALNAMLNLYDADGKIQFDADKRAAREYFLQHVNQNTVFLHSLKERLDYLVEKEYYEGAVIEKYSMEFIQKLNDLAYGKKFRFETFLARSSTTRATRSRRSTASATSSVSRTASS